MIGPITVLHYDWTNHSAPFQGELDDVDVEIDDQLVRVAGIERKIWPHQYTRPEVPVVEPPQLSPEVDTEQDAAKLPATWQSFYLASG